MIKNRLFMFIAIFLLIVTLSLNIILTQLNYFSGTTGVVMSIPFRSSTGYHYWGIALLTTMIIGLGFLIMSLKKFHGRIIILTIMVMVILPAIAKMYM